jgi:hypothetical protein
VKQAEIAIDDLLACARLAEFTAAQIRDEIDVDDPEARPRTADGCDLDDAAEWDATARRLREQVASVASPRARSRW